MPVQLPIIVSQIDIVGDQRMENRYGYAGKLVRVRPLVENPNNLTYVGIYLGELIDAPKVFYYSGPNKLRIDNSYTPAIFVPALNRVVWGSNVFWDRPANDKDLFREVTQNEIDSVGYERLTRPVTPTIIEDSEAA